MTSRGTETILLAEDEKPVRLMIRKTLETKGYTMLAAQQGQEALDLCEHHSGPIHLMVTDVVMPQISGKELAERLVSKRPEMRVLYISGYPDNAILPHGVLNLGAGFLQKPFSFDTLEAKVREILDGPLPKINF